MAGRAQIRKPLATSEETLADLKARFLRALRAQVAAKSYNTSKAARAIDRDRTTPYKWAQADPEFAAAWNDITEEAADMLEEAAMTRAFAGSDVLMIFLLKALRPEKFREQVKHELSGPSGGPIPFSYGALIAEVEAGSIGDSEG